MDEPQPLMRRIASAAVAVMLLAGCAPAAGEAQGAAPATRTVQDLTGPVTVPAAPQRVAVLWSRGLPELATELGAPVVAATTDAGTLSPLIPAGVAAGIADLGPTAEPDPEKVAAARPDLILAFDLTVAEGALERYRAIAPVFVLDGTNLFKTPWRDVVNTVARAVGKEPVAERLVAELDTRIAALRPRLVERTRGTTVGIAASFGPAEAGIVSPVHPAGAVLAELGLGAPPGHRIAEPTLTVSPEELLKVDADRLFYFNWGYTGSPTALTTNPLWPSLRSVSSGHAYPVDGQLWTVPVPAAVRVILDDVERSLLA